MAGDAVACVAIIVTVPCLVLAWRYLSWCRNCRALKGSNVPILPQYLEANHLLSGIFCHFNAMNLWKECMTLFRRFESPVFAIVSSGGITFHVNDAALFKEICVTKRRSFSKATKLYDVLRIFGENIVTTEGEVWRRHRLAATQAFSDANHRLVLQAALQAVDAMAQSWGHDDNGVAAVPVVEQITRMTLVIFSSAAFGAHIDAFDALPSEQQRQPKGQEKGRDPCKMSFTRCMEVVSANIPLWILLPRWAFLLPVPKLRTVYTAFTEFDRHLLELVEAQREREAQQQQQQQQASPLTSPRGQNRRQNLLSLLVQAGDGKGKDKDSRMWLDERELLGNAFIFLLAGHETSAHALSFAISLLALHQDKQQAAYQEVCEVLGEGPLTYEKLDELEYCRAVMNEALRLHPPVCNIPKLCTETTEITASDGRKFVIPAGHAVGLQVYALHRNAAFYPEPDAFVPERWVAKRRGEAELEHFAFSPFSLGERSCIGRRFAQVTILVALALLLRRYRIDVPEGVTASQLLEGKVLITLAPANDFKLHFRRRPLGEAEAGHAQGEWVSE